jgi:hypothetical protein
LSTSSPWCYRAVSCRNCPRSAALRRTPREGSREFIRPSRVRHTLNRNQGRRHRFTANRHRLTNNRAANHPRADAQRPRRSPNRRPRRTAPPHMAQPSPRSRLPKRRLRARLPSQQSSQHHRGLDTSRLAANTRRAAPLRRPRQPLPLIRHRMPLTQQRPFPTCQAVGTRLNQRCPTTPGPTGTRTNRRRMAVHRAVPHPSHRTTKRRGGPVTKTHLTRPKRATPRITSLVPIDCRLRNLSHLRPMAHSSGRDEPPRG